MLEGPFFDNYSYNQYDFDRLRIRLTDVDDWNKLDRHVTETA